MGTRNGVHTEWRTHGMHNEARAIPSQRALCPWAQRDPGYPFVVPPTVFCWYSSILSVAEIVLVGVRIFLPKRCLSQTLRNWAPKNGGFQSLNQLTLWPSSFYQSRSWRARRSLNISFYDSALRVFLNFRLN